MWKEYYISWKDEVGLKLTEKLKENGKKKGSQRHKHLQRTDQMA